MRKAWKRSAAAVFFCSCGLVCTDPAIAAESTEPNSSSQRPSQGDPAFKPGVGVFEGDATKKTDDAKDADAPLPSGQSVKVGSFGQVDLHVKDLDLSMVLQLLSIQSQRNIVASRNVAGTITADLYNVDFYEALDAVLHTNGFGYKEKGNFIYVYTQAEIDAMNKAELRHVSRVVRLNYITAAEALGFVTPLISERGSIAASGNASAGFQPSLSDGGANTRADADTLVIRDYPDNVAQITDIIKQLDIRPKQVLVEATILRARLNETNAFGVDMTFLGDFALDQFTSPLGAIDELISGVVKEPPGGGTGGGAATTVGGTPGAAGVKVGIVSNSISAFIRALDQVTDTTVMANPKILVLNRQKADLLVGQRLGYLSSTSTDTSTTQTVEFLDVGTQLTLRPFVSDDGFVRMELRPSLSDGTTRTVGAGASTFVIPDQSTQELTTNVMVRNGQTIVLGGLFKEDTTVSRKQVPILGDVPILGIAFKGQDDTVVRDEVIFLVTPTVVKDESLYAAGEHGKRAASLAVLGAREGLLPWSRTKLTSSHMREALKAYGEGDREKALWSADMALGLDPTMVQARRLKEEITGQREFTVKRSMLDNALDLVIKDEMGAVEEVKSVEEQTYTTEPSSKKPVNAAVEAAVNAAVDAADITELPPVKPATEPAVKPAPVVEPAGVEAADEATKEQSAAPANVQDQAFVPATVAPVSKSSEDTARDAASSAEVVQAMEQWAQESQATAEVTEPAAEVAEAEVAEAPVAEVEVAEAEVTEAPVAEAPVAEAVVADDTTAEAATETAATEQAVEEAATDSDATASVRVEELP